MHSFVNTASTRVFDVRKLKYHIPMRKGQRGVTMETACETKSSYMYIVGVAFIQSDSHKTK